jgi:hypothetical protein
VLSTELINGARGVWDILRQVPHPKDGILGGNETGASSDRCSQKVANDDFCLPTVQKEGDMSEIVHIGVHLAEERTSKQPQRQICGEILFHPGIRQLFATTSDYQSM